MNETTQAVETVEPELEFDLPFHIHNLLWDEPFFAKISRYLKKVPNNGIKTAGVRFNKETIAFELAYNPKFFLGLSKKHRKGVLMHEFYHIALGHITSRMPDNVDPKKHNIAADLAINGLHNMGHEMLPDCALFPGEGMFKDLPAGRTLEWYFNNMPKLPKEQEEGHGDHSGWESDDEGEGSQGNKPGKDGDEGGEGGEESLRDIAAWKLRDIIQKAVEESNKEAIEGGNCWGTVSVEMRKLINNALTPKLDPKKVLGYFIKTSQRADRKTSITKINKRWAYIHPGRKWNRRAKIAISIDQSGSVGDDMLEKFFAWLSEFAKFADFTVIPFDDRVFEEKVYQWKKGEKGTKERVLCGGTNFDAPTNYVNKNDFDGHIILTDLCAPKPKHSVCQRMWVTTASNASHPYFTTNERILVVD